MIRAVIFDLDNTLYSYDSCNEVAMSVLKNHCTFRFSISEEYFDKTFSMAKKMVKKRLGNTGSSHNRILYMQNFLELLGEKPVAGALDLYHCYWDTMLDIMKPFRYVQPLFQALKEKRIKIGVLTDLTACIQHCKIKRLGIEEYIDVMVTSEEAGQEKPAPRIFELMAGKLRLNPHEILMIGDSREKDIDGAKNAGMKGILFRPDLEDRMEELCMELIQNETQK